jgi:hypothetical protein
MAAPVRSSNPKNSDAEATLLLTALAVCMAVGGLARWAQTNAAVHHMLDVLTLPILQFLADHSPEADHFFRHSQLFTWLLIQAAILIVPWFLGVGIWLLATERSRRLHRLAHRSLINDEDSADLQAIRRKLAARKAK